MANVRRSAADPLGHGMRFENGDLVVERRGTAPVGLALVRGVPALAQALRLVLETQLGSDPLNTEYGFDSVAIGALGYGLHTRKEFVRLQLVRTIAADRRVKEIRELFFDDDDRFFELNAGQLGSEEAREEHRRRVHASRRFEATVQIETRSGSIVTIDVGGIGV
jgi:hypothetical protein